MISENICIGLLVKYLSVGILKTFECHIFTKPQDCLPLDIQNIATVALTSIWAGQVVRGTNPLKTIFFSFSEDTENSPSTKNYHEPISPPMIETLDPRRKLHPYIYRNSGQTVTDLNDTSSFCFFIAVQKFTR